MDFGNYRLNSFALWDNQNICIKMKNKKLTLQEKITSDIDDEIGNLTRKIQKKYKLSFSKAKDKVNYALRVLMLSFPEKWLKK